MAADAVDAGYQAVGSSSISYGGGVLREFGDWLGLFSIGVAMAWKMQVSGVFSINYINYNKCKNNSHILQ